MSNEMEGLIQEWTEQAFKDMTIEMVNLHRYLTELLDKDSHPSKIRGYQMDHIETKAKRISELYQIAISYSALLEAAKDEGLL